MTFIKTWNTSYNNLPTTTTSLTTVAQSYITQLIAYLVSQGWTMTQYTLGTGSVVTGTVVPTLANCIWAAAGTNHSWFVLQSPNSIVPGLSNTGSNIWFLIDLNNANVYNASFSFHNVAPTGGTATAAPTSTTVLAYSAQQYLNTTLTASTYFHFISTSQGHFVSFVTFSGNGYVPFMLSLLPLIGAPASNTSGYAYPFNVDAFCSWLTTAGGVFGYDSTAEVIQLATSNTQCYMPSATGATFTGGHFITSTYTSTQPNGTLSTTYYTNHKGWNYDGTVAALNIGYVSTFEALSFAVSPTTNSSSTSCIGLSLYTGTCNLIGSSFPSSGDAWSGEFFGSPIFISSTTAGKTAYMGTIADITVSGQVLAINAGNNQTPSSVWLGGASSGAWFPGGVMLNL